MVRRARNGATWRIGTDAEVAWIANGTSIGRTITAAIPPVFEAYATVVLPERGAGQDTHDRAVLALLREQSAGQPWWLGYLDTGADDIVFPDAPKVTLYSGWRYVLVEAGPEQAATWRQSGPRSFWKGALPNLMFPADRSWLLSTLWDDDWTCIGGPAGLVDKFVHRPGLEARWVALGEDATPPGHRALLRMTSLEGVWRRAVMAGDLGGFTLLSSRGWPLLTVANGPLLAWRSW